MGARTFACHLRTPSAAALPSKSVMVPKMEREDSDSRAHHSDFSIDHILNRAGGERKSDEGQEEPCAVDRVARSFDWLRCTRFCPPRVPRAAKRETPQKRQLGRYPRIPFTSQQVAALERRFQQSPYLSSDEAAALSDQLQLADVKVKIWFQNRRARKRREEAGAGPAGGVAKREGGAERGVSPEGAGSVACTALPFVYLGPPSQCLGAGPAGGVAKREGGDERGVSPEGAGRAPVACAALPFVYLGPPSQCLDFGPR